MSLVDPSAGVGNLAWEICALVSTYEKVEPRKEFLQLAECLAAWIDDHCRSDGTCGGYFVGRGSGGPEAWLPWQSTEHNLDVYVAMRRLARVSSQPERWKACADHARRFVDAMYWKPPAERGRFLVGTKLVSGEAEPEPRGGDPCKAFLAVEAGVHSRRPGDSPPQVLNRDYAPLDVNTWAVLALRDENDPRLAEAMEWARERCRVAVQSPEGTRVAGYHFHSDTARRRGVFWSEGTAQAACAWSLLGDREEAARMIHALETMQRSEAARNSGGIPATSGVMLDTGIPDARYYPVPHVGATAWYLFAKSGVNPYWD